MRYLLVGLLFVMCSLRADMNDLLDNHQTFVNDYFFGKGLVKEIMMHNLSAVKCVEGAKVYLKPERIFPSEQGLMLITDDQSFIALPKVYSDSFGCYIRSALICTYCAHQYTADEILIGCPQCRSDSNECNDL